MNAKLNSQLNEILWGRRYINVVDAKGNSNILIAKDLELSDKVWMDFIYEQALADGKTRSLMPHSELAFFLDEAGVWTKADDKNLENLKTSFRKAAETLSGKELSKRELKQSDKIKDSIGEEINRVENKKARLFNNTLEVFADAERVNAAVFSMLYLNEHERYWRVWADFLSYDDKTFINNATSAVFNSNRMSTKDIREASRSTSWRIKWNAYKTSGNLFDKPLVALTNNQENMIYWSQVYDSVYESMDRPEDSVINDDEALDEWFSEQSQKRKKREVEHSTSKGRIGSSNIWRHGEVGIVVGEAIEADLRRAEKLGLGAKKQMTMTVEEVNNLNDPLAKKFRQHQEEKIKEHGVIAEVDLRSDKNSRRVIGASDVVFKKGKRADGFTTKRIVDKRPGGTL